MRTIIVSAACRAALAAKSPTGQLSREDARQLPDGSWEVEIDDDIACWLGMIAADAETAIWQLLQGGKA